jgi:hypothetical protein
MVTTASNARGAAAAAASKYARILWLAARSRGREGYSLLSVAGLNAFSRAMLGPRLFSGEGLGAGETSRKRDA